MQIITPEMIFGAGLFATVAVFAFALSGLVFRRDNEVIQRLRANEPLELAPRRSSAEVVGPVVNRISAVAARPFMPKNASKASNLRRDLAHAGIYSASAMEFIVGLKVILMAVGAVGGYLLGNWLGGIFMWMGLYLGAVLGFMTPTIWLRARIRNRRRSLDAALPDALDLMVVCVESGLTLDAAIQRVGQEIAL